MMTFGLVAVGFLTYALLAFAFPVQIVQLFALPAVAFAGLALRRAAEVSPRAARAIARALAAAALLEIPVLAFLPLLPAEGGAEDPAPWAEYQALAKREAWREITARFESEPGTGDWRITGVAGYAYEAQGNPARAEALYRGTVQANPDALPARFRLAQLLERTGRRDEAGLEYERLLNVNPREPDFHFAYGELLARLGRTEEARRHLAEAARLYPEGGDWRRQAEEAIRTLDGLAPPR